MASKLGWIIVIVLVSNKISFASSIRVRVGTLQYLHRHPKLRSCADEVLKENLYVGGRVDMLNGECEGLNSSWVINQTVQSGYAYTKKVSVQESYIPPLEKRNADVVYTIPGVLREGAIVATEVEDSKDFYGLYIAFADSLDYTWLNLYDWEDVKVLHMGVDTGPVGAPVTTFRFSEKKTPGSHHLHDIILACTPPQMTKEMKHKISFKAHAGSLELFVDDQEICMVNTTVDPTTLKKIHVVELTGALHGIEFIDA